MAATMSYHIDAPVETVFDYFKDPSNQVDSPPFSDMEVHDAKMTKEGVGTHYSWSVKMFGIPVSGFEVITDLVPNKNMTEMSSNAMVGTWEYTFEPEGAGTKLTMVHRQRSLWAVPPLKYLTDYLTTRFSGSFIEAVKPELEAETTKPRQPKRAAKPRRNVGES